MNRISLPSHRDGIRRYSRNIHPSLAHCARDVGDGWLDVGGSNESEAIGAIHAARDRGINLIDTAPVYGFGRSRKSSARRWPRAAGASASTLPPRSDSTGGTASRFAAPARRGSSRKPRPRFGDCRPTSSTSIRCTGRTRTPRSQKSPAPWTNCIAQGKFAPSESATSARRKWRNSARSRPLPHGAAALYLFERAIERDVLPIAARKTSPCWPMARCAEGCCPAPCRGRPGLPVTICARAIRSFASRDMDNISPRSRSWTVSRRSASAGG